MTTKQAVLEILESQKGKSVSGSKISSYAGVTRAAVWKAVNDLRREGYIIEAVTNKGYKLSLNSDILSPESIMPYLDNKSYNISVYDTVNSTNSLLKQMAINNAPDKTIAIANEQTEGRGRRGNSFYSPFGSGIYISILLRPQNMKSFDAPIVTTATAVAVCNAVSTVCQKELSIKWINDLFFKGKKVCGILTEASTDFESGNVEYIIIGIGLNLITPKDGFPKEISDIAGAISDTPIDKSRLSAEILTQITDLISNIDKRTFIIDYKKRLFVLGEKIKVITPISEYDAEAIDIDDNAQLIVKTDNGEIKTLNAGEIRIRKREKNEQECK